MAARILLGSAKSQVGWLVLAFGSIFFWAFAWHADLSGWRFRAPNIGQTRGAMLGCTDTHFSEGGSKTRRGIPVYENRYRYTIAGQPYVGSSFVVGQCIGGTAIPVEYLLAKPAMSRIVGTRRAPLSAWATLAALIPGTGLMLIVFTLARGRTHLRLLRDGLPSRGRLIEKRPHDLRVPRAGRRR